MKLNIKRMMDRIEQLSEIGRTEAGGACRIALTDEDQAGRELLVLWMKEIGLEICIDEIGNIFGILSGKKPRPPVMMGSHIDTVGNGGHLDGCYGVIAALEVLNSFVDCDVVPDFSLCVAIFTNEEGVRFQPDMMGSLVYAGGMTVEEAHKSQSQGGASLKDELMRTGFLGNMACGSIVPHAFLELHIEQGPVLEKKRKSIGAVEDLQGISWTSVMFTGQANHAGTTPMDMRKDAGFAAERLTVAAREISKSIGNGQVATVGEINFRPNLINVVPGSVQMSVDLRNSDEESLMHAENMLEAEIKKICAEEDVSALTERLVRFKPVQFDQRIVKMIAESASTLELSCLSMTSGAGHDAQMMARICPSAMIFVPSRDGISHNPAEYTSPEDLENGVQVLHKTILKLMA